jgi:hypothetical protein
LALSLGAGDGTRTRDSLLGRQMIGSTTPVLVQNPVNIGPRCPSSPGRIRDSVNISVNMLTAEPSRLDPHRPTVGVAFHAVHVFVIAPPAIPAAFVKGISLSGIGHVSPNLQCLGGEHGWIEMEIAPARHPNSAHEQENVAIVHGHASSQQCVTTRQMVRISTTSSLSISQPSCLGNQITILTLSLLAVQST